MTENDEASDNGKGYDDAGDDGDDDDDDDEKQDQHATPIQ